MGACTTSKDCKIVIELLDGDLETLLLHRFVFFLHLAPREGTVN
jgi:hypothetical protein